MNIGYIKTFLNFLLCTLLDFTLEWSEIAKETFLQEVKRQVLLKKLDKIFEHSELTDEDALRLGEKVKEAGYKELKEKGLV